MCMHLCSPLAGGHATQSQWWPTASMGAAHKHFTLNKHCTAHDVPPPTRLCRLDRPLQSPCSTSSPSSPRTHTYTQTYANQSHLPSHGMMTNPIQQLNMCGRRKTYHLLSTVAGSIGPLGQVTWPLAWTLCMAHGKLLAALVDSLNGCA
jgi:hypothetical protein